MTEGVIVRGASRDDSGAVAPLLTQLGYPTTAEQLAPRFERVSGSSVDAAWVALDVSGTVIGFASGHLAYKYELDRPVSELTSLVVDASVRRSGAGRVLVASVEAWAAAAGALRFTVATAFHRADAHAFYEALGYQQLARKYEKSLA